jgi:gamma-aminobutyric acid type B receptor
MWRIYYIFHNPSPNKKIISDYHLIGLICCITVPIIVLLVIGFAIPYSRPDAVSTIDDEHPAEFDERSVYQEHFIYRCYISEYSIIWLCLLFLYLGILQVIALVMAVQTRKVRIKILNDSKEVAAIIYITSIILIGVVIIMFSLSNFLNTQEALLNMGFILGSFVILAIIFIPKFVRVYKEVKGIEQADLFTKVGVDNNGQIFARVEQQQKIAELESQLSKLKAEIDSNRESELRRISFDNSGIIPKLPTVQENGYFETTLSTETTDSCNENSLSITDEQLHKGAHQPMAK